MKYVVVNVDNGDTQIVEDFVHVSDNFLYSEFACQDGSDVILYSGRLVKLVQAIRDEVGPLSINSAFRNPSHNKAVGGVTGSYHQYGVAVDMALPRGYTTDQFAKVVEKIAGTEVGIGRYNTFVHLDIGHVARWDNR